MLGCTWIILLIYLFCLFFSVIGIERYQENVLIDDGRESSWQRWLVCSKITDNPKAQYSCLLAAASFHEKLIHSKFQFGPRPLSLGIVMFATHNILSEYALAAIVVNLAYCIHNNYSLKIFDESLFENYPHLFDNYDYRWNKVKLIERLVLFNEGGDAQEWGITEKDYWMWIDADFIFLNMHFKIDSLIIEYDKAHFFASAEHSGSSTLINSGAFIVRNSFWSKQFLQSWWEYSERHLFSDQEQFDMLYAALTSSINDEKDLQNEQRKYLRSTVKEKVVILDANRINTDPPAMTKQSPLNNVIHLMGEEAFFRMQIFQMATDHLIKHINSLINGRDLYPLPWQLNITRAQLLDNTLLLYGEEAVRLLSSFERELTITPTEPQIIFYHPYEKCVRLSNIVHHYCHAAEYLHQTSTDRDQAYLAQSLPSMRSIKTMRKKVYFLLKENQQRVDREVFSDASRRFTSDDLEMLKSVVIAGQHLLHDQLTLTASERMTVSNELLQLLQSLKQRAHPMQLSSLEMIESSVYVEQAMILVSDEDYGGALSAINQAIALTEEHAVQSGSHLLLHPLLVRGNVYALLREDAEAISQYERCLEIIKAFYWDQSEGTGVREVQFIDYQIEIYYNYGLLLYSHASSLRDREVGFEYLQRAKRLIEDYYVGFVVASTEDRRFMTVDHAAIYERIIKALK